MHKVGRNDPCFCGSGKKYKKCCEAKEKHKKFEAKVLSSSSFPTPVFQHAQNVSNFYQRKVVSLTPLQETKEKKEETLPFSSLDAQERPEEEPPPV